jgi:hypothetical protein
MGPLIHRIQGRQYRLVLLVFHWEDRIYHHARAPERVGAPLYKQEDLPIPNQSSYTFEILLLGNGGLAFVRNLNLVVEMMDGLPPST